uniref:Uncharacterized protein n=1 Tax=Alexandrium monilatum TaxID=311494 RepID=A0A7S4T7X2_9DINO|mmetsp:Transcript_97772/g.310074  ORF Transcript_97772/g.310074 Transcript_97772/m.310074 type:complete len:112 (-) Transcript_97772:177-512(-)
MGSYVSNERLRQPGRFEHETYDILVEAVRGYMHAHEKGLQFEKEVPGILSQACWVLLGWIRKEAHADDEDFHEALSCWEDERVMDVRERVAFRVLPADFYRPHHSTGSPPS